MLGLRETNQPAHLCGQPPHCNLERFVSELQGWLDGRVAEAI